MMKFNREQFLAAKMLVKEIGKEGTKNGDVIYQGGGMFSLQKSGTPLGLDKLLVAQVRNGKLAPSMFLTNIAQNALIREFGRGRNAA